MPKPRMIVHCGTAQVFEGRIPMPPPRLTKEEREALEDGQVLGDVVEEEINPSDSDE